MERGILNKLTCARKLELIQIASYRYIGARAAEHLKLSATGVRYLVRMVDSPKSHFGTQVLLCINFGRRRPYCIGPASVSSKGIVKVFDCYSCHIRQQCINSTSFSAGHSEALRQKKITTETERIALFTQTKPTLPSVSYLPVLRTSSA